MTKEQLTITKTILITTLILWIIGLIMTIMYELSQTPIIILGIIIIIMFLYYIIQYQKSLPPKPKKPTPPQLTPVNILKHNIKGGVKTKNWFKTKKKSTRNKLIGIHMELTTGGFRTFMIDADHKGFSYNNGKYLIDNKFKQWNSDTKLYWLQYHEKFALPINTTIPISKIDKAISTSQIEEISYATNPDILEKAQNSKVIEGILKAVELIDAYKKILLVAGISLFLLIILVFFALQESGVLKNIGI